MHIPQTIKKTRSALDTVSKFSMIHLYLCSLADPEPGMNLMY